MDFYTEIEQYLLGLKELIDKVDRKEINAVLNKLLETYKRGGFIYIFGNGGSAATASHFVNDFNKGASEQLKKRFKFISLNDNVSTVLAIANDINYSEVFKFQLENYLSCNDLVIGISGSGNSENVINAISFAKERGAETIALVGYGGGKLKEIAHISIHIPIYDMQKVEDLHMVMDHLMMKILK
ncbi:MAG: SIS domain-containing protein, partial [Candidatus Margulisiibacteriota bacterium]